MKSVDYTGAVGSAEKQSRDRERPRKERPKKGEAGDDADPVVMAADAELNGHQQREFRRAETIEGRGLERSSTPMESQLSGLRVVRNDCSQSQQRRP